MSLTAILVAAGCGGGDESSSPESQAKAAIAQAESSVVRAAALPMTGLWSEAHLMDRLVRTGVLPRPREGKAPEAPWMGQAPIGLNAGGGEVFVWIYADSAARLAVTSKLDPETGAPPGTVSPFAPPMVFVTNNNLAAIISGGTEQNIERIMLALQAGLPAAP